MTRLPEISGFRTLDLANTEWSLDVRYVFFAMECIAGLLMAYTIWLANQGRISQHTEQLWVTWLFGVVFATIAAVMVLPYFMRGRRRGFSVLPKDKK